MKPKIHLDDPRLTTYALGELDDANERRLVENALASDPELRAYVHEIHSLGRTLKDEFASESTPSLQRSVAAPLLETPKTSAWRYAWPVGLAASIAAVAAVQLKLWAPAERLAESPPNLTTEPTAVAGASLDQQLQDQAEKVEEARLKMLDLAERYQIVDVSSINGRPSVTGDPVTGQGTILMSSMADTYKAEAAIAQAKMQVETLEKLEGDQLIRSAAMLDIQDPTLQTLWPEYQNTALQRQAMLDQGLAESDPQVQETTEKLEAAQSMLLAATDSVRETLATKVQMAEQSLNLAQDLGETKRDDSMDERRKVAEYSEASKEVERQQTMLANMQAMALSEDTAPLELAANTMDDLQVAFGGKQLAKRRVALNDQPSKSDGLEIRIPVPPTPKSTESYASTKDNAFKEIVNPGDERATFSTDVDTASYANVRRFLTQGQQPPRDAVRIEEMINYFDYAYPNPPPGEQPFTVNLEVSDAPWTPGHRLLRIGLKARDVMVDQRPDSNLVFLVDVSGSMAPYNKLPLLKKSLISLTRGLTEQDFVSIVAYAGESRVVLEPTNGSDKSTIIHAIEGLQTGGGGTNGESGIRQAYELAKKHATQNGANRLLLATDGDFNVGVTSTPQLITMAKQHAKEDHIFLTVLGFGEGNLQDDRMEQLANQVDGAYHYIDSEQEGHKVLIEEMSATLVTVAKDVKLQVEFNPAKVKQYRLIGYANRLLQNRDFRDDSKDAGDMGAGHRVTAFYEVVPTGHSGADHSKALLKYRAPQAVTKAPKPDTIDSDDLVTVRISYKEPTEDKSQQQEFTLSDEGTNWQEASEDFRFAASVAAFGMRLRQSPHCNASLDEIKAWAQAAQARDEFGRRGEFLRLIEAAKRFF